MIIKFMSITLTLSKRNPRVESRNKDFVLVERDVGYFMLYKAKNITSLILNRSHLFQGPVSAVR